MISYNLSPGDLKTFSVPGKPFLSFDQFLNIVQWYRDYHYAAENISNYAEHAGKNFTVWTVRQHSTYLQHVWLDQLKSDLILTFEIPHLERNATFPLRVRLIGKDGELFFTNIQELAVERLIDDRFVLTSWRRIPDLRDFLIKERSAISQAA